MRLRLPSFLLLLLLGIAGLYATRPAQACPLAAGCHHPCCRAPLTSPPAAPPSALMWGSLAAAAVGAFAAEVLRRKKEREKRLQEYYNRPQVEPEGKNNRLTGKQIARAYQNAMNQFKAKLQQAQALGMSAAQAAQLKANALKSGKIGASLDAAKGYIAQKEAEEAARDAAYHEWREKSPTPRRRPDPPSTWRSGNSRNTPNPPAGSSSRPINVIARASGQSRSRRKHQLPPPRLRQ